MTKLLRQFWKSLDELPGPATDRRDWRLRLGAEYSTAQRFLRKTGLLATAIDCPSPGGDGCPRRVIKLPTGAYRAVCQSSAGRCESLDLTQDDLAILELDGPRLFKEISAAFAILPPTEPVRPARVVCLGQHAVAAGLGVPVFFVMADPGHPLQDSDFRQGGLGRTRAVVLVPSSSSLPASTRAHLAEQGHLVVSLSDTSHIDPKAGLALVQPVEVLLQAVRADLLARAGAARSAPVVMLPPGTTWGQITLTLTSRETLICKLPGDSRQMDPSDFGMRSGKNAKTTNAWALLVALIAANGVLTITAPSLAAKVKKQKQTLATRLRSTFGLASDPIPWGKRQNAYVAEFIVRDDRPKAERDASRRR